MKDHDTASWSISIRTIRYYLRIIFWIIDGIIHCMWCIVKFCAEQGSKSEWKNIWVMMVVVSFNLIYHIV